MAATSTQRVEIQGRELALTNLDRVLWPEDGLTKGDLIEYLVQMSPVIMPYLQDRPLVLTRYPAGIDGESFYQKNLPQGAPEWVPVYRHQGPSSEREISYVLCDHPAVLAWLGNQAAIEIHPWFSRTDNVDLPDIACFDLDPVEPAGFDECRPIAWMIRRALEQFGLQAWLKTSGATGLHLYVPIQRRYSYREIAHTVGRISDAVHQTGQAATTRARAVARRPPGTVYLDHLQNVLGKTLAMAYGPRPRPGAPVSAPIAWEELGAIQPGGLTLRTMPGRVALLGDLFSGMKGAAQDWAPVMRYFGRTP